MTGNDPALGGQPPGLCIPLQTNNVGFCQNSPPGLKRPRATPEPLTPFFAPAQIALSRQHEPHPRWHQPTAPRQPGGQAAPCCCRGTSPCPPPQPPCPALVPASASSARETGYLIARSETQRTREPGVPQHGRGGLFVLPWSGRVGAGLAAESAAVTSTAQRMRHRQVNIPLLRLLLGDWAPQLPLHGDTGLAPGGRGGGLRRAVSPSELRKEENRVRTG